MFYVCYGHVQTFQNLGGPNALLAPSNENLGGPVPLVSTGSGPHALYCIILVQYIITLSGTVTISLKFGHVPQLHYERYSAYCMSAGTWWLVGVDGQTSTDATATVANPNPNCFLDPTRQWDTSASNYADCTTSQAKAQGLTSCCKVGGKMCAYANMFFPRHNC